MFNTILSYYILSFSFSSIGVKGVLAPIVAAWTPSVTIPMCVLTIPVGRTINVYSPKSRAVVSSMANVMTTTHAPMTSALIISAVTSLQRPRVVA